MGNPDLVKHRFFFQIGFESAINYRFRQSRLKNFFEAAHITAAKMITRHLMLIPFGYRNKNCRIARPGEGLLPMLLLPDGGFAVHRKAHPAR